MTGLERAGVGVTDNSWAAFLRDRPHLREVNFWWPSGPTTIGLRRGDPFLFKTHSPGNRLVGGGFVTEYRRLHVSEAWDFFREGNGVDSHAALLRAIHGYRRSADDPDPMIGCLLLAGVFFVPDELSLPGPPDFAANIVRWKGYRLDGESYVERALEQLLLESGVRDLDDDGRPTIIPGPVFRDQKHLVLARAAQGAFSAAVTDAYHRRCAVTGNHVAPVLQAAHIRPVAEQGQNLVPNGLLLRSDVHILFDKGYLGVDTHYRIHVSPRLRSQFGNGTEFYALAGTTIDQPDRRADRPDRESLEWHMDSKFLAA